MLIWMAMILGAAIVVGAVLWHRRAPRSVSQAVLEASSVSASEVRTVDGVDAVVPFASEQTDQLRNAIFSLAYGVSRFDYPILGPHRIVFEAAKDAVATAVQEERYFPRRPALLPKLLRALNSNDSTRQEIVRLILQDAVLAGNVLKRANSAFYRQGNNAIESVDRAVVILGNEGLRVPVATAVMQPVFRLPRGFFDRFAPITWDLAQRTAAAAEVHARLTRSGDPFVAHLLGLLGGLGRIVLFRLTLDKYRLQPNALPRADVFIRLTCDYELRVTRLVAEAWEMSDAFLAAIDAQAKQTLPRQMSPLARTLYYANLCGQATLLAANSLVSAEQADNVLRTHGLDGSLSDAMRIAASNTPD